MLVTKRCKHTFGLASARKSGEPRNRRFRRLASSRKPDWSWAHFNSSSSAWISWGKISGYPTSAQRLSWGKIDKWWPKQQLKRGKCRFLLIQVRNTLLRGGSGRGLLHLLTRRAGPTSPALRRRAGTKTKQTPPSATTPVQGPSLLTPKVLKKKLRSVD